MTVSRTEVVLVDPKGKLHLLQGSVPEFCRGVPEFVNSIRQHYEGISRVIRKERRSHKGWKLA